MSVKPPAVLDKVNYRYEAIIDFMLSHPDMKRQEIARALGYTPAWLSTVISSDAFKVLYEKRRSEFDRELHDSTITKVFEVAQKAAGKVSEKLDEEEVAASFALDSMSNALKALGFGAPKSSPSAQVNNTQVNVTFTEQDRIALREARDRLGRVAKSETIEGSGVPLLESS